MEILSETFELPMRDNVKLSCILYQSPKTALHAKDESFPSRHCLLIRTDYWDECVLHDEFGFGETLYERLLDDGWVIMIVHVRGQCGSQGVFAPYTQEINDGIDTMDWLGSHEPYRHFRYILYGNGYSGQCALYATIHAGVHPEIVGLVCGNISTDMREWGLCTGGVLNGIAVRQALDWVRNDDDAYYINDYPQCQHWHAGVSPLSRRPEIETWFLQMQKHCSDPHFWEHDSYSVNLLNLMHPHILTMFFTRWRHPFCPGTIAAYEQFYANCIHRPQINISDNLECDQDEMTYEWLHANFVSDEPVKKAGCTDSVLQNNYNIARISEEQTIDYDAYVLRNFDASPPRLFYLAEGSLTDEAAFKRNDNAASFTLFQHDPRNECFCDDDAFRFNSPICEKIESSSRIVNGPDCAVFVAPALTHAGLLFGIPRLRMWVDSNRSDATFIVRLNARNAKSTSDSSLDFNICHGVKRISAQLSGAGRPPTVEKQGTSKDDVVALDITLRPVAVILEAGMQIRLEVTSSDYPRYVTSANALPILNAAAPFLPAVNTIYHSRNYPSRLWLPLSDYMDEANDAV